MEQTTTTTTTTKPAKINLSTFLDMKGLTRAEKMYYERHNQALISEVKSVKEWEKSIKFNHK